MAAFRLALAQVNPTVGDLAHNRSLLIERMDEARDLGAQVILFPELVLTGYPPEDLLLNGEFLDVVQAELERLIPTSRGLIAIVGFPMRENDLVYNAAALLHDGALIDCYAKGTLPNYGVFDEKRYFRPGLRCPVYQWGSLTFGVNICEDLWTPRGVPFTQARGGARMLLNISSSPYHAQKGEEREVLLRYRARSHGTAIAYVNLVGGQDELIFDGESMVVDARGEVRARGLQFAEQLLIVDVEEDWLRPSPQKFVGDDGHGFPWADETPDFLRPIVEPIDELENQFYLDTVRLESQPGSLPFEARPAETLPSVRLENQSITCRMEPEAEVYAALRVGLQDYVRKNGFAQVLIGLSGGIDSALTAALAADALGPERVIGVSMPTRFNSAESRQGARDVAGNLKIRFHEIPIETLFQEYLKTLRPIFAGAKADVTEENIQARIRGNLLMALSNKWCALVLATGNKSELAVGYCTLYGDMVGGFAVIKDVPKTLVYRLARYRNALGSVIPEDTMTRPPSAELRENQKDVDTLPPYEVLDAIIQARMEGEEDPAELVRRGLSARWVETVYRWIDANEYKRRQAPPGVKITPRAFGRDRRYPITNRWRWGNE